MTFLDDLSEARNTGALPALAAAVFSGDGVDEMGHRTVDGRELPHDPASDDYALPAVLGPAGDISMAIGDYATFLAHQIAGVGRPARTTVDVRGPSHPRPSGRAG